MVALASPVRPSPLVTAAPVLAAVAAATAVSVRDPHVVGSWGACPFHAITGAYCPGCGALRGIERLMDGDLFAAVGHNALLIPALVFLGWSWLAWASNRGAPWHVRGLPETKWVSIAWLVAVGVFGVARNLPGSPLAP